MRVLLAAGQTAPQRRQKPEGKGSSWWRTPHHRGNGHCRHSTSPAMSCDLRHCGLSGHFTSKTIILIQKNPGNGGMTNINKCLMVSLCFLVPVITEIVGLRWGGGCRWDKMNDLDCLDFSSSHCSSTPSLGTMWKTNRNKQEQRRDPKVEGEVLVLLADLKTPGP